MKAPLTRMQIWGAPIVLGSFNAVGLVAALFFDEVGDAVSWIALALPAAVALWRTLRQG